MSQVIRLQPASRMAARALAQQEYLTVVTEDGPRCICCGMTLRSIPGQDAQYVRCRNDACLYCNLAFASPVPEIEHEEEAVDVRGEEDGI